MTQTRYTESIPERHAHQCWWRSPCKNG